MCFEACSVNSLEENECNILDRKHEGRTLYGDLLILTRVLEKWGKMGRIGLKWCGIGTIDH
jgi:hypothetical protein